jgi:hypothetical protein
MIAVCACLVILLISLGLLVFSLASPAAVLYTGAAICLFILPGIFVGMTLFGKRFLKNPESLIFGAIFGIALSDYSAIAAGYLFQWSAEKVLITIACVAVLTAAICWQRWNRPMASNLRPWVAGDYAILMGMFAAMLAFVAIPFRNLGKLTPDGYAYTWLFGFDFLLRSAQTAMITLHLPPDYLHLTGHEFHYYLASFALPAFAYSASSKVLSLHPILLLVTLFDSFLFLSCLYAFLRHFVVSLRALAWTAVVALVGYSYYAWYILAKDFLPRLALGSATGDDAASLMGFGNVSHLFQRLFLDEPQALTGLSLLILVLFLLEKARYKVNTYALAVVLGLALGIEFGIEGFYALVLALWFGLVQVIRRIRARDQMRDEYGPLAVTVGVCSLIYASFFILGLYELASGRMLLVTPNWWALKYMPMYFALEYGPMLLLGLWGLRIWWQRSDWEDSLPLFLLFIAILLHVLFITGTTSKNLGLMRGNRLLPVVLLVWTGIMFEKLFRSGGPVKARRIGIALVLAAVPTYFTDAYFASNVYDRGETAYVRVADRSACEWIRRNLPEKAIVQGEPDYMGLDVHQGRSLSLIADFAERPMVLGQYWIASTILPGSEPIARERLNDLHQMFEAKDAGETISMVKKYNINYIYYGPYETHLYPEFLGLLRSAPYFFREVYSKDGVHIFETDLPSGSSSQAVLPSRDMKTGDLP